MDWADHTVVTSVFEKCSGTIISVMDAGDNVQELLLWCRASVDVISISEAEHALFWLKWQSVHHLHPDRRLNLLGIHPSGRRVFEYHHLRQFLPKFAQGWWDLHEGWIREGIIGSGIEEQYYQHWWTRMERWVGRWPTDISLEEHQHFVSQLFERPRWKVFQRLNLERWLSTWKQQIQHQNLSGLYWEPIFRRTVFSYQQAPTSLHPTQRVAESTCHWTLYHTSMLTHLQSQSSNSAAGIYLGEHLVWTRELGNEVLRVLKVGAPVLLWQHDRPLNIPELTWQEANLEHRGFLAGHPWVAVKEST